MRMVQLQQICEIQIGKTPLRSIPAYWGGDLPWVTIRDLSVGRSVAVTNEKITKLGAKMSGSKLIPKGTLLLSFKLTLGKRSFAGCDLFTNEAIAALQVLDQTVTDPSYLYWVLDVIDYERLVDRAAKGKTLNKAKLKLLEIPLPPLAEQKRIAAILDAADAMRAKRREAIALLDTLLHSTFIEMFGDPVTNPMKTATLKEVASAKSARLTFRPSDNIWQLNLDQIESQSGRILNKVMNFVSEAGSSTHFFDTGNVLYSKLRPYLNKVVCPDEPGIATTELVPLRPDPNRLDRQYLTYYLRSQRFVSWVSNEVAGAKMPRVTMKVFWDHAIPLPPLALQHRFAAIVKSIEHQKALHRAHLAELDALFASLQQRAFNGELSK